MNWRFRRGQQGCAGSGSFGPVGSAPQGDLTGVSHERDSRANIIAREQGIVGSCP